MLDLKTLVLKKQQEQHEEKTVNKRFRFKNKQPVHKKQKKPTIVDETSKLEQSYVSLQRKAQQYDDFVNGRIEEPEDAMVDFDAKELSVEEKIARGELVVTYDEFGRSRLVRPDQQEDMFGFVKAKQPEPDIDTNRSFDPDLAYQSHSFQDRDWIEEGEYQRQLNHFNPTEKRVLGTGYYKLSQDQQTREKQFQDLQSLRDQTIDSQERKRQQQLMKQKKLHDRKELLKRKQMEKRMKKDQEIEAQVDELFATVRQ
ncbi:hypothetical protein EDD86DRAFT_250120 [Gorgonomyces haynaldii]|nr:hypothetical protein EDD86DRAFT_250120 [Gorgonomyces haynaldii]